jgi:ATP-binding cassette subfamily F protein uup
MVLLTLREATLSFGGPLLLDHVNLGVDNGERIALLGRNGSGKSSLLKVIAGQIPLDDGERSHVQGLRIAYLSQEVPSNIRASVFDTIAEGLGDVGRLLSEYQQVSRRLAQVSDERLLQQLDRLHHELDKQDAWKLDQRVATMITRMQLVGEAPMSRLSGGMRRRVWLARELISEPDLLLLDEPTNHLDIDNILWLEAFLKNYNGTLMFISHDRTFVRHLAGRILELDRGRLTSWECDFDTYVDRRDQALEAEEQQNRLFDKKLAQEEIWIRQGIKARRTRNEGRVRALKRLREERRARRDRTGTARLAVQAAERSGKLVAEVDNIRFSYPERCIVSGFSTTIMRGDKLGIIGLNGSGKTTLIRLLLGQLRPDAGTVRLGTQIEVAYFDQLRRQLDEERSVIDNVAEGSTRIDVNGQSKHVIGYLQDFLFSPDRARTPVKALSGGERNRLLLAKLFTRPANVLVLDEPTNDLDVETLELLEALLVSFNGTLILVSHDRSFLNNVVTSTLVIGDNGRIHEYIGNYDDAIRQYDAQKAATKSRKTGTSEAATTTTREAGRVRQKSVKLSYKDQRELDALPARIEQLEAQLEDLHRQLADPAFYKSSTDQIAGTRERADELQSDLEVAYQRWEELEALQQAGPR